MLVFYAAGIFIYLWISTYSSPVAKESARLLLSGNLAGLFWGVFILIGIVVPLILEFVLGSGASAGLIVSSVLVLVGNLTFRYAILKAGRYNPLVTG